MTTRSGSRRRDFEVIDQNSVNANWNGLPLVLKPNDNANMPQTPTGSVVLGYGNQATGNNPGELSLTSGGGNPIILPVPALANQLSIYTKVWGGNNLSITNTSNPQMNIPIFIEAFGPGVPGQQSCKPLVPDATPTQLVLTQCAQGQLSPRWMQVILQANTGDNTIFALIGGPTDNTGNNAYVISLNDPNGTTGYGTSPYVTPPPGYFATTTANYYTYTVNWGGATVYLVNMSSQTAAAGQVSVRKL